MTAAAAVPLKYEL